MLPFGQDGLRDGLKTRGGIESRKTWPNLLFSDEALRPGGGLQGPAGRCWGVPAQGHQALRRAHGRPDWPRRAGQQDREVELAVKVIRIQEHEALWTRALVMQARANRAGSARLHKLVFDKAFLCALICGGTSSRVSSLWCRRKTIWP
jgi:hypothetical protein